MFDNRIEAFLSFNYMSFQRSALYTDQTLSLHLIKKQGRVTKRY